MAKGWETVRGRLARLCSFLGGSRVVTQRRAANESFNATALDRVFKQQLNAYA
jgi:hypothetical protein